MPAHHREVHALEIALITQGNTGAVSVIEITQKRNGEPVTGLIRARVGVFNDGSFTQATNATIAGTSNYATLTKTNTSAKDLEFESHASNPGKIRVNVTDASAETVRLIADRATWLAPMLDGTGAELDVTHAAP